MILLKRFALLTIMLGIMLLMPAIPLGSVVQASQSSRTGMWKPTGSMHQARSSHTATLLKNGLVLVAGGWNGSQYLSDAELYHPQTGVWTATAKMHVAHANFTATLLHDGKVLVVGGMNSVNEEPVTLATAELYNPTTGRWTLTGSLHEPRESHTATLLNNGEVLVTGGSTSTASAELYNPTTGKWTLTGKMSETRMDHAAVLLKDGKVLVVGGDTDNSLVGIASAEVYNPHTGLWSAIMHMHFAHRAPTATLLNDGRILVAGGADVNNVCCVLTAEVYNPRAQTWSDAGTMTDARGFHSAVRLKDGEVLALGGQDVKSIGHYGSNTAEIYNPHTGAWTATSNMHFYRLGQTETLLRDGSVLVTGGGDLTPTTSAEIFTRS